MRLGKLAEKRQDRKSKEQLSDAKSLIKEKRGTTLVETMVTLFLISIMMAMAASALSSASKIFVRIQKTQYAQSILDTTMTELRNITKDASGYVKIYPTGTGFSVGAKGSKRGRFLEFLNAEGYVVLVSQDGCKETQIYIGDQMSGTSDSVETGQLLTRYYFRNSSTGTYVYQKGSQLVARAVAPVFGKGFYMKNYLDIRYSVPKDTPDGSTVNSIVATVTLYSDKDRTNVVATDSETLEFRKPLTYKEDVTAIKE